MLSSTSSIGSRRIVVVNVTTEAKMYGRRSPVLVSKSPIDLVRARSL
jgi:hypothetical protein